MSKPFIRYSDDLNANGSPIGNPDRNHVSIVPGSGSGSGSGSGYGGGYAQQNGFVSAIGSDADDVQAVRACKQQTSAPRYADPPASAQAAAGGPASSDEAKWSNIPGLADGDDTKRTVRRYLIEMHFSMAGAAENPASTQWNVHSGMYYAFKRRPIGEKPGSEKRTGMLERALLLGGAVHQAASTAPAVLLVQFAGMRGNRYTNLGKRAPFWIFPGTSTKFQPAEVIFKPDDAIYSMSVKNFAHLTEEDLERGITYKAKEAYALVPPDHPVVHVVRMNQELIGIDFETMPLVDGEYKLHKKLVDKCQRTLRQQVFEQMPFTDLTCWQVALERSDGLAWDDPTNIADLAEDEAIEHELMEKMNRVIIDLELTFILCGPEGEDGAEAEATPK